MSTYDWMYREPPPDFLSTINKYAADGVTWSGMEKLLEFDAYDEQTGCPNVVAVDRTIKANFGLTKMASSFPAEMLEKIAEIEDKPDRIHVVGNALGATETFGSNRNQDSFPRLGLMNSDPKTYGHKTFEDAHVFKHHVNKDPNKSIGKVTYAFYDSLLDKVLLLYYILKDKAPHIVDRLEKGESLETSMGCRCPYDVCSICGKKAKDRTEYCAHLRDHPNMVYPDGRKVMAHTPHPRFFDQSHVAKGADPIAKTLKVVDTKAKEAWDRRPKIHPMYARTPELAKAASFVEEMGRNTKTAFEIRQSLEKTAAPYRDARGIPMGDPDAPRRSDTEINAMLDDPLLKINSEDLKRWRSRFHKTAECPAVQGTGNCSCHEKLAEAQTLEAFLKAGRQVQASIDKRIPGMAQAVPAEAVGAETVAEQPIHRDAATNEIKIAGYAQEFLDTLEFLEPDLETDFLAKLAEGRSLEEVLSSLTASGIVLKNYEFDFLTKVADRGSRSNILVSPKLVRHGILGKIAESVRDARSYLPRHMFKRASFLAGALRKYANQQFTPQQVAQLAQLMQMMQAGPGLSPRGQGTYIPDSLRRSMADEALLHLYRTNMGQMRPSAFDEVPDMSLMPGRKTGSVASFVDACRGVPVNACLKYAYCDRSHIDVDAEWLWRDIPESDVWFQTFVANTRGDSEKTASLLAAGPGDLLDAAATVHLRFVRGVLVPGSTKE